MKNIIYLILIILLPVNIAQADENFSKFSLAIHEYFKQQLGMKWVPKSLPPEDNEQKLSVDLLKQLEQTPVYKSLPDEDLTPEQQLMQEPMIALQVTAKPSQVDQLYAILKLKGLNIQAQQQDDIFLMMPYSQIHQLSNIDQIKTINLQNSFQENQYSSQSDHQPTPLTNINPQANQQPLQSQLFPTARNKQAGHNIKIGIIDFGYAHYPTLLKNNAAPVAKDFKTFTQGKVLPSIATSANSSTHGSACIETIYKLAPAAQYYLAQIGTGNGVSSDGDIFQAIDWLVSQGVHIINFSGSSHSASHDGNAPIDIKISRLNEKNILWVNAAGNDAQLHWVAPIQDQNNNGFIDNPHDNLDVIFIKAPKTGFNIRLNWDDWSQPTGQETQNIDINALILGLNASGKVTRLISATTLRAPNTAATEYIKTQLPAGYYALALQSNMQSPKNIHVYLRGAEFVKPIGDGSIGIPATANNILSVGAWNSTENNIASYSGQGHTDDGRIKPELSAPTDFNSIVLKDKFTGTSAASAYVTGIAGLIWSQHPEWSVNELKQYLLAHLEPVAINTTAPNNQSGYGLVSLDKILSASSVPAS
jgi:subtilisin family serine protease